MTGGGASKTGERSSSGCRLLAQGRSVGFDLRAARRNAAGF